ncbi:MAG: hypothetical protein JNL38_04030 [Myxococcales bacterium]|nr:hypothetical protein [Myxococcales bacterium]
MSGPEALLAEAIAIVSSQRGRAARDRHRELLGRAIAEAERAAAEAGGRPRASALVVLARAQAARADDALHGANQLSLSAQRAPSPEECDEGWGTVAALAEGAADAAQRAADAARLVPERPAAAQAARRAAAAADAARALVRERNDAYVFHAAPGFSFGEGWHLAAAALLADVTIQVEPGQIHTAQAERFLHDAGLDARLRPPRPRPRAAKQVTGVVARAFGEAPGAARARLREAFLGGAAPTSAVRAFVDARVGRASGPKVLVWIRRGGHHPGRNTSPGELAALVEVAGAAGARPVLVGDAAFGPIPEGVIDLTLFWKEPLFQAEDGRRAQLQLFEHLTRAHGAVGQLGVTTAGMDGPALLGLPTAYLTDVTNPRMRAWVGAVPGYVEVVRSPGYLDQLRAEVGGWLARPPAP